MGVGAVGGCDMAVGGIEVVDGVAGSTSIGGGGGSRALKTSFSSTVGWCIIAAFMLTASAAGGLSLLAFFAVAIISRV
uniref:Uncharacterized protein n=1 Tax=Romanomermis culicivorax TaxID=13658 RepID=A0A915KDC5_ROMCU